MRATLLATLLLAAATGQPEQLPVPRPVPNPPAPPVQGPALGFPPPAPAPVPAPIPPPVRDARAAEVKEQLQQLKAARQALDADRAAASREINNGTPASNEELARLRRRLSELLGQVAVRSAQCAPARPPEQEPTEEIPIPPRRDPPRLGKPTPEETPAGPPPDRKPAEPPVPKQPPSEGQPPERKTGDSSRPLDALALGNSLFSLGDYDSALAAYRQVNLVGLKPEERVPVQYLIAACLRRTGKVEEASNLFREVANAKGDPFFAECAQWQLAVIRWRQETENKLKEVRERREALGRKP